MTKLSETSSINPELWPLKSIVTPTQRTWLDLKSLFWDRRLQWRPNIFVTSHGTSCCWASEHVTEWLCSLCQSQGGGIWVNCEVTVSVIGSKLQPPWLAAPLWVLGLSCRCQLRKHTRGSLCRDHAALVNFLSALIRKFKDDTCNILLTSNYSHYSRWGKKSSSAAAVRLIRLSNFSPLVCVGFTNFLPQSELVLLSGYHPISSLNYNRYK